MDRTTPWLGLFNYAYSLDIYLNLNLMPTD